MFNYNQTYFDEFDRFLEVMKDTEYTAESLRIIFDQEEPQNLWNLSYIKNNWKQFDSMEEFILFCAEAYYLYYYDEQSFMYYDSFNDNVPRFFIFRNSGKVLTVLDQY